MPAVEPVDHHDSVSADPRADNAARAKPARQRCGFCQQKLTRDHLSLYLNGRWFHQGQCFDTATWLAVEAMRDG